MMLEISVFVIFFLIFFLRMENKREWVYNLKHNKLDNWRKTWRRIPTTKLALVLFIVLLSCAVVSSLVSIELNYLVWDFFFILHYGLFILAGASLYLFIWCLGGRAVRVGSKTGEVSPVEGTEPSGKREIQEETFADGMFKALFDVTLGESKRKRKRKKR